MKELTMLHIFAYIYEKQYERKIQKNWSAYLQRENMCMCMCVFISYLFHLLVIVADEHVTVNNLPLVNCLYGI